MKRTHLFTLEELGRDHASSLEVEVLYEFTPGERMVRYYPDGSGYPGSPPEVEFISSYVYRWDVGTEQRKRGTSWLWEVLDVIATRVISSDWDCFRDWCLENVVERIEEDRED